MHLRPYRTSIILAITFTLVLSTFWFLPQLAFIIFISMLLQLLLSPLVERLVPHLSRALASALVLLSFVLLLIGTAFLISSSFIPTFTQFIAEFPRISADLQASVAMQDSPMLAGELDNLWGELQEISVEALKSSLSILPAVFGRVIDLVIIFFVTFYLLKDGEAIKSWIASLFPSRDYTRVIALFDRILLALRTYICSQLVICCITGTVVFLYFTLRGLPYGSVFAVASGIAEFIPVLGPTVASIFGTLLTATTGIWFAIQTACFYLVLTQINHNIVYPTLIGRSLNLHPVAIILGIILGGEVLGPAGMFLAVPFIVICKLVIEDIHRDRQQLKKNVHMSRWLNKKLASEHERQKS